MSFGPKLAALDGAAQGRDGEHRHAPKGVVWDAHLGDPDGRLQIERRILVGGLGDLAAPLEEHPGYELIFGHAPAFAIQRGTSTAPGAGSGFSVNVVPLAVPGPRRSGQRIVNHCANPSLPAGRRSARLTP